MRIVLLLHPMWQTRKSCGPHQDPPPLWLETITDTKRDDFKFIINSTFARYYDW